MRRTSLASSFVVLCACAASAQEAPFRVETPFAGGERWALREELVTREVPLGQDERRGEVNRFLWTESAEVLERGQGFALRLTLESFHLDATAPNVETRVRYDADDLKDFPRTWTFEYDPTWRLLDVSGQRETMANLYDRMLQDAEVDEERCPVGRWIGERAKPFVVDRWSRGFEGWQKRVCNDGGAPVRAVMARLRAGEAIDPGSEVRFEGAGELAGGAVRYVGRDADGARFRVAFDAQGAEDRPAPEYSFVIDDAGRLTRLESKRTKLDGGLRTTTEYTFTLDVEGRGEQQPAPQGVDTGAEERDPVDDQVTPRGRGQPF